MRQKRGGPEILLEAEVGSVGGPGPSRPPFSGHGPTATLPFPVYETDPLCMATSSDAITQNAGRRHFSHLPPIERINGSGRESLKIRLAEAARCSTTLASDRVAGVENAQRAEEDAPRSRFQNRANEPKTRSHRNRANEPKSRPHSNRANEPKTPSHQIRANELSCIFGRTQPH